MKVIVELEGIDHERDDVAILGGVTWRVEQGQHWAILGPNGCGKTTLLKILAGYEWPTRGTVRVLGDRYGEVDLREVRRHIGWVSSALAERHPRQATAEDVAVSGIEATLGLWREFSEGEREQARASLARLRAGHLARRAWGVLSQGERQRVLIARALTARPSLLVLDEPCAGLDPVARAEFLGDLAHLVEQEGAPGVLFVTHHVEELGPWLTHGLLIRRGVVLACGPIGSLMQGETLSALFERPVRVEGGRGDWRLLVERPGC